MKRMALALVLASTALVGCETFRKDRDAYYHVRDKFSDRSYITRTDPGKERLRGTTRESFTFREEPGREKVTLEYYQIERLEPEVAQRLLRSRPQE